MQMRIVFSVKEPVFLQLLLLLSGQKNV